MKLFDVSVRRPPRMDKNREDIPVPWRNVIVLSESFEDAARKSVAYYNDIDGVDDYFVSSVSVYASTDEGEGNVLLV